MSNTEIKTTSKSNIHLKSSKNIFQDKNQLSALEAIGFCIVLEQTVDQLVILSTAEIPKSIPKDSLHIESLSKRAQKYIKIDPIYNIVNGERFQQTLNKLKYLKIHIDRTFLEDILIQVRNELKDVFTYNSLKDFLKNYYETDKEEKRLICEEDLNKRYASLLKVAIKKKVDESRYELHTLEEAIGKCKDDMEIMLFDNALKTRYLKSWENARIEQRFMLCDQNEKEQINIINQYRSEIEKEIRINDEIVTYINENQKDIEEGIEHWMKRYDTELEERQTEIQAFKDRREEQQLRYKDTTKLYHEHAQAIEEWLDYKEKKRIEDERKARRLDASIRLQAWWRGLMVRLQLGPFNPKRKKGKKGKKK